MAANSLRKDVASTLKRLEQKDPGLKRFLEKAYGYAVFPTVGRAALVIGGAYGKGMVFEKRRAIGFATIAQTTIGVQVGGDTFTEVIAFESKESLDRFKKGRIAFTANASAVLVKAGAAGTTDYEKGVRAFVYASGGMLLEADIGGQKFKFKPMDQEDEQGDQGDQSDEDEDQKEDDSSEGEEENSGLLSKTAGGVRSAASKVADLAREHPVAASLIGLTVVGGLAVVAVRWAKSSAGDQSDEDEGQEDEGDDSEAEDRADDQGDEGSDEGEDDDEGEENEEGDEQDQKSRPSRRGAWAR